MQRDDLHRLSDMLDAAKDAMSFISGRTYGEFVNDRKEQFAVCRAIEIVGEEASHVSSDFRKAHPEIPWGDMIGMRNRLAHDHSNICLPLVWDTANNHLPELIDQLESLLPPETGPDSS